MGFNSGFKGLTEFQKKKSSDINFYDNPFSGSQFVLGGQTDTHDEVNSHLS